MQIDPAADHGSRGQSGVDGNNNGAIPAPEFDAEASAFGCMLASEPALSANWNSPEEDAAWAHL